MDEHVLVPFDGSPLSERALERAIETNAGAEITVLYVVDPVGAVYEAEAGGPPAVEAWQDRMAERAREICAEAERRAVERDCAVRTATETGAPHREILAYVAANDVDHVIMGSHGRSGVSRLILGSVAERVIRGSPVPVTVVR